MKNTNISIHIKYLISIFIFLFSVESFSAFGAIPTNNFLSQALQFNAEGKNTEALLQLNQWQPSEAFQQVYKNYYLTLWGSDLDQIWAMYADLKKQKRMIRLRLNLLTRLIQASPEENKLRKKVTDKDLKKEAQVILKQLRNTSEGEIFESNYINWIKNNSYFEVACAAERKRWLTQPDLDFTSVQKGLSRCPVSMDDFLLRLRRLIFAAKEKQASEEIEIFFKSQTQMPQWQKIYIKSVFDSNVGDPLKAFESLGPIQNNLLNSEYADNYFFISQRAGQIEKAFEILKEIEKNNLKTGRLSLQQQKDFLFQKGFLFYQNSQYSEAYKVFNQLYQDHQKGNKKRKKTIKVSEQIAWLRAWTLYLDKKYEEAEKSFLEMQSYTSDSSRLNYWLAMTYLQNQKMASASLLLKKMSEPIILNQTFTFYNLLAWVRLSDLKNKNADLLASGVIKEMLLLTKTKNSIFPSPGDEYSRDDVVNLYNVMLSESSGDELSSIISVNDENAVVFSDEEEGLKVGTDEELRKHLNWAEFLISNNEIELAKWHLYDLEKNVKVSSQNKLLVQFYSKNQFYYRALSLTNKRSTVSRLFFDKDELALQSLYPKAYEDVTNKYSSKNNINPYFIWSIMKAETQFKSDAISPVGAVGLMQFMPYTLEKLNTLTNTQYSTMDLFKPENSIEMGSAYLKKLFIEFNQQKPLVAASYNGGPHRVKSWLSKWKSVDYDIFIEHIPFAETRTYVKKVLTFDATYEKIYNQKLDVNKYNYLITPQSFEVKKPVLLNEEWDSFKQNFTNPK